MIVDRRRGVTPVVLAACGIGLFVALKRYKVNIDEIVVEIRGDTLIPIYDPPGR